jgi:hypothetical protein
MGDHRIYILPYTSVMLLGVYITIGSYVGGKKRKRVIGYWNGPPVLVVTGPECDVAHRKGNHLPK